MEAHTMKILVGIPTFNRAESLARTLERFANITRPRHAELCMVVVNNNCTDHTDEVVRQFQSRLPLQLVHEPRAGVSYARTAIMEFAVKQSADYIVFADDDVLPALNWLPAYEAAFLKHPDSAVFGGSIEPWFEVDPPTWLINAWPAVHSAYGIHNDGKNEEPLLPTGSKTPFGANYAIRTKEHAAHRYDPLLGIRGNTRFGGEETVMIRRILSEGSSGWWVPEATVKHFIPAEKMGLVFLARYFHGQGASQARVEGVLLNSKWGRRWAIKAACLNLAKFAFYRLTGKPLQAMQHFTEAFSEVGHFNA